MLDQVSLKEDYYSTGVESTGSTELSASSLLESYGHLEAGELLQPLITDVFKGKIAVSSSFGAESAILLHLVAQIDPDTPVLFMDTGKLFQKTVEYRDTLAKTLGLTNIRIIMPDTAELNRLDPNGDLWQRSTDACCDLRKVVPFDRAIEEYDAIITGRKRYQATTRTDLDMIEHDGKRIKVNPVANWDIDKLQGYMDENHLPAHPLVADGYLSIGCEPCTSPVKEGEDPRAGRWRGEDKTECGIHFVDGKLVRTVNPA